MKKFGTTFILLGVFVVLLLVVVFFTSDQADRKRRESEVNAPVLSERQIESVDQIVFSPVSAESVTLVKADDDRWKMAEVFVDQDEQDRLTIVFESFEQGKIVSRTQENWDKYGLTDEKASKIVLKTGEKELAQFYFGSGGPSYQSVYVRRNTDSSVYLVNTELDGFLRYNADRWKNKHLFAGVSLEDLQAATVRVGEEKWQFRKQGSALEWLDGDTWKSVDDLTAFKAYADSLLSLKADALEADTAKFEAADNAIALTLQDGTEYIVAVDQQDENLSLVKITGQTDFFRISSDLSAKLKPDFLKTEPAPAEISPSTEDSSSL